MKNILIVDNDVEFVCWLGALLLGADYQPWPACNVSDAITVVGNKPVVRLDLLIVNPALRGASGLISTLYNRSHSHLKVIGLGSPARKALPAIGAWWEKPDVEDLSARKNWIRAIQQMSHTHKRAA